MCADTRQDDLAERVESFLRRNFPQIAMHGGASSVERVDRETGEVRVRPSGACGGCGISPVTVRAIEARLPLDVDGVSRVHAEAVPGDR